MRTISALLEWAPPLPEDVRRKLDFERLLFLGILHRLVRPERKISKHGTDLGAWLSWESSGRVAGEVIQRAELEYSTLTAAYLQADDLFGITAPHEFLERLAGEVLNDSFEYFREATAGCLLQFGPAGSPENVTGDIAESRGQEEGDSVGADPSSVQTLCGIAKRPEWAAELISSRGPLSNVRETILNRLAAEDSEIEIDAGPLPSPESDTTDHVVFENRIKSAVLDKLEAARREYEIQMLERLIEAHSNTISTRPDRIADPHGPKADRKRVLQQCQAEAKQRGVTVTYEMIAKKARSSWNTRTMVTWWLAGRPEAEQHDGRIRKVLDYRLYLQGS